MGFQSSAGSPLGSTIQTAEIDDGQVTYAKLGTDLKKWELLETLTFSSDTTKTSGSLDVKKEYLIEYNLLGSVNDDTIGLQFNGDTGNNYSFFYCGSAGNTDALNQSNCNIGKVYSTFQSIGNAWFSGLTPTIANGQITININMTSPAGSVANTLQGQWKGGNATQIDNLTIFRSGGSGNFTGTFKIYGRD